ncbi:MAG: hypothetical protein WCY56_01695 [Aminobacteriaceae bacterium]
MRRSMLFLACAALFVLGAALPGVAQEDASTFHVMGRVEQLVYGIEHTGGLIDRLSSIERDMFGRELPGSIAERQAALLNFIERGTEYQPSLLFKLGVAEWAIDRRIDALSPVIRRVESLEVTLEGSPQVDRPVTMRLERVLGLLLSESVTSQEIELPEATVIRASLAYPLSPKSAKKGDVVDLTLDSDLVVGSNLLAPKGSRVTASVEEVTKPRSFGRPAEVKISIDSLFPLGPTDIPLVFGEESKQAVEAESAQLAAAGTSVVGALLLGPVGLVTGFLVRGDLKELPAGSVVFSQTAETVRVGAFPVPLGLRGLLRDSDATASPEPLTDGSDTDDSGVAEQ